MVRFEADVVSWRRCHFNLHWVNFFMETLDFIKGISPRLRFQAILCISEFQDWQTTRRTEANTHAISPTETRYIDNIQQVIFNIRNNPSLKTNQSVVLMTNTETARGTIIENIQKMSVEKKKKFEQILQEKYDTINKSSCRATLTCRRCGSDDVSCDQKQTRGAGTACPLIVFVVFLSLHIFFLHAILFMVSVCPFLCLPNC